MSAMASKCNGCGKVSTKEESESMPKGWAHLTGKIRSVDGTMTNEINLPVCFECLMGRNRCNVGYMIVSLLNQKQK